LLEYSVFCTNHYKKLFIAGINKYSDNANYFFRSACIGVRDALLLEG